MEAWCSREISHPECQIIFSNVTSYLKESWGLIRQLPSQPRGQIARPVDCPLLHTSLGRRPSSTNVTCRFGSLLCTNSARPPTRSPPPLSTPHSVMSPLFAQRRVRECEKRNRGWREKENNNAADRRPPQNNCAASAVQAGPVFSCRDDMNRDISAE